MMDEYATAARQFTGSWLMKTFDFDVILSYYFAVETGPVVPINAVSDRKVPKCDFG